MNTETQVKNEVKQKANTKVIDIDQEKVIEVKAEEIKDDKEKKANIENPGF
jgi:hypothetical protein